MEPNRASRTALGVAHLRAAHQLLDGPPHIAPDPVAPLILGEDARKKILAQADEYRSPLRLALRSHVILRTRYAEEKLKEAVARGIDTYVLLGAGFDTFALRRPEWGAHLKIVEIDHPATQRVKKEYLKRAGLELDADTALVEADFERESLKEILLKGGVGSEQPAFFSWLGVTMYLNLAAIRAVLETCARRPAPSGLVLTFAPPDGERQNPAALRAAELGEPWLTYLTSKEVSMELLSAGFREVSLLTPEEAFAAYYENRPADLPPPTQINIASAWA